MVLEFLIAVSVLILAAAFVGMAGRTALALLLAPGIYLIALTRPHCWAEPIISWSGCLASILIAPVGALIGPIAHNEEDPPNPYPGILLIALGIVIAWTAILFLIKRYRKAKTSS